MPTTYDYLEGSDRVLSHDGETASIIVVGALNADVIAELGRSGRLKGRALEQYLTAGGAVDVQGIEEAAINLPQRTSRRRQMEEPAGAASGPGLF